MRYQILGDSDCPLVRIDLMSDESVKIERGAMAYLSNVELEGKMNSSKKGLGAVLGSIGRSLSSGESMFMTHAKGLSDDAYLGIAPSIPGKIKCLHIESDKQYYLNTGAFLASDESVDYIMRSQNVGKALLGGTGGFFIMETTGEGLVNEFRGRGTVLIQTRNLHSLAGSISAFIPSSK